ncbi:hypothetical protein M6B38_401770 [Iris pallida]|uniref:Uncharacterized protein n=1 Tax=Iris pallida TaxID=29817 RepID=A0AAX6FU08_IRIPA|nr:hypothetical protein M6B38_401770 [Iris pallida]
MFFLTLCSSFLINIIFLNLFYEIFSGMELGYLGIITSKEKRNNSAPSVVI